MASMVGGCGGGGVCIWLYWVAALVMAALANFLYFCSVCLPFGVMVYRVVFLVCFVWIKFFSVRLMRMGLRRA